MKERYKVKEVSRNDCEDYVLNIHYAKRWPSVSYAYGLFLDTELVGIVTYGTPFSSSLQKGLAGEGYACDVLELNRLCLRNNIKNEATMLVSRSLKLLPPYKIIISFADTSQGHHGCVYQAANFIYCGLSAKRTNWKVKGKEHLHSQTIADEFRGTPNRAKAIRDKYGDDFYLEDRSRKHRYIYITGSKVYKKRVLRELRYMRAKYPKDLL